MIPLMEITQLLNHNHSNNFLLCFFFVVLGCDSCQCCVCAKWRQRHRSAQCRHSNQQYSNVERANVARHSRTTNTHVVEQYKRIVGSRRRNNFKKNDCVIASVISLIYILSFLKSSSSQSLPATSSKEAQNLAGLLNAAFF